MFRHGLFNDALNLINSCDKNESLSTDEYIRLSLKREYIRTKFVSSNELLNELNELSSLCQSVDSPYYILSCLILKTIVLENLDRLKEALTTISEARNILRINRKYLTQEQGNTIEGDINYYSGSIYWRQGNLKLALNFLNDSLRIRESLNDEDRLGDSINRIGTVCIYQRDYSKALEYFNRNIQIHKKRMNKWHLGTAYNNIAEVYRAKGEYETASKNYEVALAEWGDMNYEEGIILVTGNLGHVKQWLGDYEESIKHLKTAIKYATKTESYYLKAGALLSMIDLLDQYNISEEDINTYLVELEAISNDSESVQVKTFYKIANALKFQRSSKISDRIKAKTIFSNIVNEKTKIEEFTIPSFIHLLRIYLEDLIKKEDLNLINKLVDLSKSLIDYAIYHNSLFLQTKSHILESKVFLLNLNYTQANMALKKANNSADKYQNQELIDKIAVETDTINNMIESIKKDEAITDRSIKRIIEIIEIEKTIMNLLK